MEASTLPQVKLDSENDIRKSLILSDRTLVSSIHLELPHTYHTSNSITILNDPVKTSTAKNVELRNKVLKLHGISVANPSSSILKEYIVCIFQTRAILMYRSIGHKAWLSKKQKKLTYQRVQISDKDKEVRRVQNLAIRTIYALGLDYGVVKCGIGHGKKTLLLNVNTSPKLTQEMEDQFVQSIRSYSEQISQPKVSEVMMGADPEFVMKSSKGDLLIASNYFPVHGRVGCDAIWMGQNHSHKPLVEIRPEPTSDPRQLALRIYQGLLFASKKMRNHPATWLAGAMPFNGFPLGGHIHFSGIQPNFKLLRALDNYLSFILVAVEDKKGIDRRPKYGFLGDFRYQPHGGFEYRTLPSWLISPTLTKGIFVAAKLIVSNYHLLHHEPLKDIVAQEAYYKGDKEFVRVWVDALWDDLKGLEDFKLNQRYLDDLYQYIQSGKTWNESLDFRKNWKIYPFNETK